MRSASATGIGRRRKLLALGGLAALLGLARNTHPAEAGHTGSSDNVFHLETINNQSGTGEISTGITAETVLVAQTGSGQDALRVRNRGNGGSALRGVGGSSPGAIDGGDGLFATGGSSSSGSGGNGVRAQGGLSETGPGGPGVNGNGGTSENTNGGDGLIGRGGDTSADGFLSRAGRGVFVTGGNVIVAGSAAPGRGVEAFGGFVDVRGTIGEADPNTTGAVGVFGEGGGADGFRAHGVHGRTNSNANSINAAGVFGENLGTGPGVRGFSGGTGTGSGVGVHGKSGSGPGVKGDSATGTGAEGTSGGNFTQGLLGAGTGQAHGVTGTSVNVFGLSGTSTNSKGFVGVNQAGNDFAGLFVGHGFNPNNFNAPGIFVKGGAVITGGVSVNALTSQGSRLLHGIQAADDLAEDVGRGQLQGGRARVNLDPLFAETIRTDDYHVFLTPHSADSRGLALVGRDSRGFDVRELGNGTGSYAFDWRVVAERKEAPAGSRLMRAPDPDLRGALEKLGTRPIDPPDRPGPTIPQTHDAPTAEPPPSRRRR